MTPHYEGQGVTLWHGDCLDVLATLPDASVDAVVTDPPYSLGFMGRTWDSHNDNEDAGFAYWLSGFADGEGCFRVQRHERGTYTCTFSIKVRRDERGTLERIQRFLGGVGTIRDGEGSGNAHPQTTYAVQDKAGCMRLLRHFDKYPLQAKKRLDYEPWALAVLEWHGMKRGNRWHGKSDWSRMAELKARVEGARQYVDPAWSGHGFQDWCRLWAAECLRVLKPGGHLLAFGGSRTHHRLTSGVEDAGFEIRDTITWHFASGFPKSLDVSKAIDAQILTGKSNSRGIRQAVDSRHVVGSKAGLPGKSAGQRPNSGGFSNTAQVEEGKDPEILAARLGGAAAEGGHRRDLDVTAPATDAARQWAGWGTALKPATEFIVVARKPLTGTVAANVQAWGTGALNIDATRIGTTVETWPSSRGPNTRGSMAGGVMAQTETGDAPAGRWPANVIFDETQAAHLDEQSGERPSGANPTRRGVDGDRSAYGDFNGQEDANPARGADTGGASRFFFVAKADASERPRVPKSGAGDHRSGGNFAGGIRICNVCANRTKPGGVDPQPWPACGHEDWVWGEPKEQSGHVAHPTVKPLALMRHLVRLVTPPGGTVLEPFAGSGTTVEACLLEGFRCIAIEKTDEYLPLVLARIHRQRDPVQAIKLAGEDLGLFDFGTEETA